MEGGRLIAVEHPGPKGATRWRVMYLSSEGQAGFVAGWSEHWIATYGLCVRAIHYIECNPYGSYGEWREMLAAERAGKRGEDRD